MDDRYTFDQVWPLDGRLPEFSWLAGPDEPSPDIVSDALVEREGGFVGIMWARERAASASLKLSLAQAPAATRMLDVYARCAGRDELWRRWKDSTHHRGIDAFVGYMFCP